MPKNKFHSRGLIVIFVLITSLISSCAFQKEKYVGKELPAEEICRRIRYVKKETTIKLKESNYVRKSKGSYNINLLKNSIEDKSSTSWYYEVYVNGKGTEVEITYTVEYGVLWFKVEVNGLEGDFPIEDYKMAISFYQEFTYANIAVDRIYKLLEKRDSQAGEYRLDSIYYQDVFVFEKNENNDVSAFLITGLVKSFEDEK